MAPLYKRLPHGPHRLEREEVVLNQRTRIHGAMVESVARRGYEGTSVKQVIGLAGVSRRSFYEQFANKEECFLVTFDLLVRRDIKRLRQTYLAADGSALERARAAFQRFAEMAGSDRNAIILVVLEAQRAGAAGVLRLRQAAGACEQMLARSFAESPDAVALPTPIVRGIVGGLHGIASTFLREARAEAEPAAEAANVEHTARSKQARVELAKELLDWTLLFQTPAAEGMAERMAPALTARMRELSSAHGHRLGGVEAPSRDDRTRVLQGMLRLVTRDDYRSLSAPQIAEEANVSVDRFCALFADKQECFLSALDMIGDELLEIAADPDLIGDDWPRAVRRVLGELMRFFADHPLYTRMLAQEAFFGGAEAMEHTVELSQSIATLLTEGAPQQARSRHTIDAIAGAIWHTVRCQVAGGRVELLAALSDHLTYIVLAPYIGAEAAVEIVTEEREERRPSRVADATGAPQSM
ncbi:MAG TPA: TetR/AcrR family transcriptional regulator [Solirubrobacteraceae bacterium]|nr:TetR/AcrR family transcriptional regulator [Solirubrobacteraceae bacterium]